MAVALNYVRLWVLHAAILASSLGLSSCLCLNPDRDCPPGILYINLTLLTLEPTTVEFCYEEYCSDLLTLAPGESVCAFGAMDGLYCATGEYGPHTSIGRLDDGSLGIEIRFEWGESPLRPADGDVVTFLVHDASGRLLVDLVLPLDYEERECLCGESSRFLDLRY